MVLVRNGVVDNVRRLVVVLVVLVVVLVLVVVKTLRVVMKLRRPLVTVRGWSVFGRRCSKVRLRDMYLVEVPVQGMEDEVRRHC